MQSLIFFIIALGILVTVHEFGHFWVARRCGVKVLRFSVGFGRPLWRRVGKDGTEYVIAVLPLGGYVKMLDEREGTVPEDLLHQSFNRQSLANRVAIVSAGPLANLIFAVFAYWLMMVIGIPGLKAVVGEVTEGSPAYYASFNPGDEIVSINGKPAPTWNAVYQRLLPEAEKASTVSVEVKSGGSSEQRQLNLPEISLNEAAELFQRVGFRPYRPAMDPVIGEVVSGGAADRAGIRAGDRLLSANDQILEGWEDWVRLIRDSANSDLQIVLERNGQTFELQMTPAESAEGYGLAGIAIDPQQQRLPDELVTELRYGPLAAIPAAFAQTWQFISATGRSLWGMVTGSVSRDNLGGPITIAQYAGSSAQQGTIAFIGFLAMISISLGILNLLPIPVLDGGHLMMYLIEWVRGKPLSEQAQIQAHKVGLMILLMLMFLAFFNDLSRLFG
ncbi:RIP metalloprotease RseP [Methylophaga lonarensis]|uniref:RIP metalloprotease RseP n=1 Tax=Methylophaga lonarensis TaxID=999151 RepID=UPI003D2CBA9C